MTGDEAAATWLTRLDEIKKEVETGGNKADISREAYLAISGIDNLLAGRTDVSPEVVNHLGDARGDLAKIAEGTYASTFQSPAGSFVTSLKTDAADAAHEVARRAEAGANAVKEAFDFGKFWKENRTVILVVAAAIGLLAVSNITKSFR